MRERIIEALKSVRDPEIPVNIYDLGLIYDISLGDGGAVAVRMTLTTPNCPVAEAIPERVRQAVKAVEGVGEVSVELVWEPAWTAERMSEAAKLELSTLGMDHLVTPGGGEERARAKGAFVDADRVFGKRR